MGWRNVKDGHYTAQMPVSLYTWTISLHGQRSTKGTAKSAVSMKFIREMFWWATLFNFKLWVVHIPGTLNIVADALSRLHSMHAYEVVNNFLQITSMPPLLVLLVYILKHMSSTSLLNFYLSTGT